MQQQQQADTIASARAGSANLVPCDRHRSKLNCNYDPDCRLLDAVCSAVYTVAAADGIRAALTPAADYFNTLGVPGWLVHWGHPGNMAVVLFAMGGYGAGYLGWQIRVSNDGVSKFLVLPSVILNASLS